ncbi:hypothetical protein [Methylobacterium sp. JK268]
MSANHYDICFAVNELYPVQKGGIGRWIFNTLTSFGDQNLRALVLLYGTNFENTDEKTQIAVAAALRGKADVVYVQDILTEANTKVEYDFRNSFDPFAAESIWLYNALKHLILSRGYKIKCVEFLDFGGAGFFTFQAKRTNPWLRDVQVGIRLHTTGSMIAADEQFDVSYNLWHTLQYDIERKALDDADYIVAHVAAVADANRRFYRFADTFKDKIIRETPPVILDRSEIVDADAPPRPTTFSFSSRLTPVKRPDTFIKGAVRALERGFDATFQLVSYGWDQEYIQYLHSLVPAQFSEKIVFYRDLTEQERLSKIAGTTVAVPSSYESYCFFAYESLLRGQKLILNQRCVAFGPHEFWKDGVNCLMYDGSVDGLAETFMRSVDWSPVDLTVPEPTRPYWTRDADAFPRARRKAAPEELFKLHLVDRSLNPTASSVLLSPIFPNATIDIHRDTREGRLEDGKRIFDGLDDDSYVAFSTGGLMYTVGFVEAARHAFVEDADLLGVSPQIVAPSGRFTGGFRGGNLVASSVCLTKNVGAVGTIFRVSKLRPYIDESAPPDLWLHFAIAAAVLAGEMIVACPDKFCVAIGPEHYPDHRYDLSAGRAAGLLRAKQGALVAKYDVPCVAAATVVRQDETITVRELRAQLVDADALTRRRYQAILDMEAMVKARDEHIAADAVMLEERYKAITEMGRTIERLERELATYQAAETPLPADAAADGAGVEAIVRDLRVRLARAEALAADRYAALQEMEEAIKARDAHIKADAALLEERYNALVEMSRTIEQLGEGSRSVESVSGTV